MTKVVTGKITKVSPLEIIVKINQASFKTFNKSKQRLTNKQKPQQIQLQSIKIKSPLLGQTATFIIFKLPSTIYMYMQGAKTVKLTQPKFKGITSTKVSILETVPGKTKEKIVVHTV